VKILLGKARLYRKAGEWMGVGSGAPNVEAIGTDGFADTLGRDPNVRS
jgi:hypothetical protein